MQNRQFCCFRAVLTHFGGLGNRKFKKYKGALEIAIRKRSGYCKFYKFLMFLWCCPHFGGLGSPRKSRECKGALEIAKRSGYCKID